MALFNKYILCNSPSRILRRRLSVNLWDKMLDIDMKNHVENYWRQKLKHDDFFDKCSTVKEKHYVLSMFPYPSGTLHMGHVRVYTISDTIARFHRMQGKNALVNWDPVDQTVLAAEQVDENGCSWRSGCKVEKKLLKQWFIRTTKFAKELYDGLNDESLVDWKDIISLQKNWIGECDGYSFDFEIHTDHDKYKGCKINIWTTQLEYIQYITFIVVAPNSMFDITAEDGKEGQERLLTNIMAINPFTKTLIPICVSSNIEFPNERDNYIGMPQISEYDTDFAKSMCINSHIIRRITQKYDKEYVCRKAKENKFGGYPVSSKLKDWLISRQRFWGTPIPIIHCINCGPQPVPYDQLPIKLPTLPPDYVFNKGTNVLKSIPEWINTKCPKCNNDAIRETDTMDTFVDSSWYFLRYLDPHNENEPFSKDIVNKMMPVDIYIGGKEHAVLHLYYARFMTHFLHSIGLVKEREPFIRLLTQGMVTGKTYKNQQGSYLKPDQVVQKGKTYLEKETGKPAVISWEKMSKSKFNGVEPSDVFKEYGIDTTRLIMMFSVAPFSPRPWNTNLFDDVLKWQHRLWLTMKEFLTVRSSSLEKLQPYFDPEDEDKKLLQEANYAISCVTYEFNVTQQLAAVISSLQQITAILRQSPRIIRKYSKLYEKVLAAQIIMLCPLAPYFAATLWHGFVNATGRLNSEEESGIIWHEDVFHQKWPELDSEYPLSFLCLVNGEVYLDVCMPKYTLLKLNAENSMSLALQQPDLKKLIQSHGIENVKFEKDLYKEAKLHLTLKDEKKHWKSNFSFKDRKFRIFSS